MPSYLEVWQPEGAYLVALEGDRVTVGQHPSAEVVLASDRRVSRLHAVLERYATGWCIHDMESSNGTFVNGRRVWGERPLRAGDEVQVGRTRLVFRTETDGEDSVRTEQAPSPPPLTRREREVLVALCRPVLVGDLFTEPASIRQVAADLGVTDAAVKQHLLRLYDKFEIYVEPTRRRVTLANEAVRRGAVTLGDLRGR